MTSLLLRKELLTNYQLDRLLKGERAATSTANTRCCTWWARARLPASIGRCNARPGESSAVKALRKRFRDDKAMSEQFFREGKIGMQLRHPSIVPIYEVM